MTLRLAEDGPLASPGAAGCLAAEEEQSPGAGAGGQGQLSYWGGGAPHMRQHGEGFPRSRAPPRGQQSASRGSG